MSTSTGAAKVLGFGVCLTSLLTWCVPTAAATTTDIACNEIQTGVVSCLLPDGRSSYDTTALLTAAQAATGTPLSASTPVAVTAFGAAGHEGSNGGGLYSGGYGGQGGKAQTVTTLADYQASFGTALHYYVGNEGASGAGGRGGASTLVSGVDLTSQTPCINGFSGCTATTLLADAGGGGGGGQGNANGDGGHGGNGGTAVSGQVVSNGAAGQQGQATTGSLTRTGAGGAGGGNGDGGSGGRGGSGVDSKSGTGGQDGIGGLGGPTHTSNGPNAGASWTNNTSLALSNAGQGGEGEFRTNSTNYGSGGGGGGGWGGGGGGGGGGEAITGGGGGGGGSFAAADTVTVQSVPAISNADSHGNGSVYVTFIGTTG
ncbi:hypothetical protein AB0N09_07310 [Streptomyces erythrochromogenes]|uniref:hypothetical protein n=1 Tax=Streptomyces erythrochromogenes TaxID=285574 RepID=UPI0034136F16